LTQNLTERRYSNRKKIQQGGLFRRKKGEKKGRRTQWKEELERKR
jgi:hypothetical protein